MNTVKVLRPLEERGHPQNVVIYSDTIEALNFNIHKVDSVKISIIIKHILIGSWYTFCFALLICLNF